MSTPANEVIESLKNLDALVGVNAIGTFEHQFTRIVAQSTPEVKVAVAIWGKQNNIVTGLTKLGYIIINVFDSEQYR